MEDIIIRGLLADSTVKIMAISGAELVEKARETHGLSRVCTAALGRTLLMTSMMGAQLKNADERVTAMLKGGGEAGNIVCTADWTGRVKGYVENPGLELPPAPNGKLDVALAVGWFGDLTVIRDMGLKEPYVGTCPIQSGEIAEDFARYFTVSEQQPSLVYLGVRVNAESGAVRAAGGLLAQPLPGCPDEVIDQLELRSPMFADISREMTFACKEQLAEDWFRGMQPELLERTPLRYHCGCSRERMEKALISLGRKELESLIAEDRGAELGCHFCHSRYAFTTGELQELLQRATRD